MRLSVSRPSLHALLHLEPHPSVAAIRTFLAEPDSARWYLAEVEIEPEPGESHWAVRCCWYRGVCGDITSCEHRFRVNALLWIEFLASEQAPRPGTLFVV